MSRVICAGATTTFNVTASGTPLTYQWQVSTNGGAFVNVSNAGPYTGATTPSLTVATTGTELNGNSYRVIVATTICGSVTSTPVSLTVNPLPTAVLVATGSTSLNPYINSGLAVTPSPAGTYTYQWFQNDQLLPGVATATYAINVDRLGDYTVRVTDNKGCSALSNRITFTESPSDIVFVYPNPNKGQFQVRYYSANSTTAYSVRVFDNKGSQVFNKQFPIAAPYSRMDVTLNNAAAGLYTLEVIDAQSKRLASSTVVITR